MGSWILGLFAVFICIYEIVLCKYVKFMLLFLGKTAPFLELVW